MKEEMRHASGGDARAEVFERYRPRLFGIAYRMLGVVHDAQDIVQDVYLRWHEADAVTIRSPEAWLVAVTTRLSIDRLRKASTERESYVGSWLPEPIATQHPAPTDHKAELASDLSMAFLVLLERLAPEERAAFLLREVLDADYDEIARIIGRSEAACRQMIHRARVRVREDRTRFTVPPETHEYLVERFVAAIEAGDKDELLALVSADATWTSDGGGRVSAARNVIRGAVNISRFVLGLERKGRGMVRHTVKWINGDPAIVTCYGEQLLFTTSVETDGERLTAFFRVLNPDKLHHAATPAFASGIRL